MKRFRTISKLGLLLFVMLGVSSVMANQQNKPIHRVKAPDLAAERSLSLEADRLISEGKPTKCYLAMHLEMVGVPFSARTVDATGAGQICDLERLTPARRN